MIRGTNSPSRHCAWAMVALLPVFAAAQEGEQEASESVQATEVEDAQVAPATELEQAPVVPQTELEEVIVTGSRIARTPEELAGNLIVLDGDFIRASGEATLERVLRQLPQNANSTVESFGSNLNSVTNFTGASTVNLRGLGSESTLVLVDGKRVGHSGFLGGVTDVSSIPLSLVERIEVLLDGASAVYGSDAVGGVINIITRRDYEGAELDLNYIQPADGSYGEWRGSLSGGFNAGGTRIRASVSHSEHSGLDGADRDVTLFQRSRFAGPQFDIRFCCLADGTSLPVLWRLDGDVLTQPEFNALSEEDQARAMPETHAVLPAGFNENSSVDEITQFGPPNWGAETQAGWHILPENRSDGVSLALDRDFNANVSGEFRVRYEQRETTYNRGFFSFGGQTFSHFRNLSPYTPFGRNVHLYGQRRDLPAPANLTDSDTLDLGIDLDGSFGDWEWELSLGRSTQNSATQRLNPVDTVRLTAGLLSDGVTGSTQFLSGETTESCAEKGGSFSFGLCRVTVPAPPAANPFGDLSDYIGDTLHASSTNEQTRFDALLRGTPWSLPAGDVSVLVGVSSQETALDSMSEFRIGVVDASPIGDIESFDTEASRRNDAAYVEGLLPLAGGSGGGPDVSLSLSGRWDSYGAPHVVYKDSALGTSEVADDLPEAGSASTWGAGLVISPTDSFRLRANWQTSFVAPQLNQLLRRTSESETPPFRGLRIILPNGDLKFQDALILEGGNPDLKPETADTLNLGLEYNAPSGLGLKVTWNRTDYMDRINQYTITNIDPSNIPSNTMYFPNDPDDPDDDVWIQERRWFNVSSVLREGVDLEAFYTHATDSGDFTVQLWHSRVSKYDVIIDSEIDEVVSVLEHTEGNTFIGTVPKTANAAQFTWSHRGLEAGLDVSTRSGTGSTLGVVTSTYEPPTIADLTLSYSFVDGGLVSNVPGWAEGARLSLTVNNLGDDYGTVRTVNDEGMELEGSDTNPSPVYGRVLNLSVHMSL